MTDMPEVGRQLQAQTLDVIKKSQDAVVQAVQGWADATAKVTPDQLKGKVPTPSYVGDPTEVVDSVFDFATELLNLNRAFAHRLLEVRDTPADDVE